MKAILNIPSEVLDAIREFPPSRERAALEDLLWAMINTKEFLLRR